MFFAPSSTASAMGRRPLPLSFNMRRLRPVEEPGTRARFNSLSAPLVADCDMHAVGSRGRAPLSATARKICSCRKVIRMVCSQSSCFLDRL